MTIDPSKINATLKSQPDAFTLPAPLDHFRVQVMTLGIDKHGTVLAWRAHTEDPETIRRVRPLSDLGREVRAAVRKSMRADRGGVIPRDWIVGCAPEVLTEFDGRSAVFSGALYIASPETPGLFDYAWHRALLAEPTP